DVKVPPTPNPFLAGNPLFHVFTFYTPKHALSGNAAVEMPSGFSSGKWRVPLDANYASRQYSFQNESVLSDPTFAVNARIALADIEVNQGSTRMTFAWWSRTLTDNTSIYRRWAANAGVLGEYGNFNPPRTFG